MGATAKTENYLIAITLQNVSKPFNYFFPF